MTTIIIVVVVLLLGLVLFAELIFRARRPRSQWVVDHAGTLEELERRLNHLDEQGFRLYLILRDGEGAVFVLVAFQPFPRWRLR